MVQSFKSEILKQIDAMPEGKIFTFNDVVFPLAKFAHIAVIFSNLAKEQKLIRIEKGAYYKPKTSGLGLGFLPVYQDEQVNYLTTKLNGYLTGSYIYNKMALTEQVPTVITIAVKNPVRAFKFRKLAVECVKAYVNKPEDSQTAYLVQILDAVKDLRYIPGSSPQTVYDKLFNLHISLLKYADLEKLVSLSENYPPRVRKILSDMMRKSNNISLEKQLVGTICPTTRFNLPYEI